MVNGLISTKKYQIVLSEKHTLPAPTYYTSSPNIFLLYGDQKSNKKKSGKKVHNLERTQRHPVDEQSNDPELED